MSKNNNCKIIQDLLPNYIDKLTNDDTNIFIEEHLKTCTSCKQIYENMKKDIESSNTVSPKKEIQYIKKYSNRLKFLKIILLLIICAFVFSTIVKFMILSALQSKSEQYVKETVEGNQEYSTYISENFHRTTYQYSKNSYSKFEVYQLENRTLLISGTLQDDVYTETRIYKNDDTVNIYTESEERKFCIY